MQRRTITNYRRETFDYQDHETAGWMVGGGLSLVEPTADEKANFEGDWSVVTYAEVWGMIHNGDRTPVTFWLDHYNFRTYYPTQNSTEFRVVDVTLLPWSER